MAAKAHEAKLRERSISESREGNCVLCVEKCKFFAIGICDHPICVKCSARMRVLNKQTFCAACKAEMDQVVFCEKIQPFNEFKLQKLAVRRKHGIRFENKTIMDEFDSILDYQCSDCTNDDKEIFYSMQELKSHLRKSHEKQFCQICMENLSLFPKELKTYTKKELVSHRKEGDKDERSHRGHPECRFCDDRFFDNDSLLLHLRKTHFWCHFCEHDGKQDYYNVYKDLRKHFAVAHYLCDEGNCQYEKFTSVFRDKIDYQAHKLAQHGKNLNKIQAKEARKVELDYSYSSRAPKNNSGEYEDYRNDNKNRNQNKYKNGGASNSSSGGRGSGDLGRGRKTDTVNFYDFDDVEKDRKVFKPRRHEAEEIESGSRKSNLAAVAASAAMSNSEPDISSRHCDNYNYDDDVIGMTEYVNETDMKQDDRKNKLASSKTPEPEVKQPQPKPQAEPKAKPVEFKTKEPESVKSEVSDFPALPGAKPFIPLHAATTVSDEAFPALQPSKKVTSKTNLPKSAVKPVSKIGTHINGIPVKRVEKKSKGKSYSKQSGRAITESNDFPSLGSSSSTNTQSSNSTLTMIAPPPGYNSNKTVINNNNNNKTSLPPGLQTVTKKQKNPATKAPPPPPGLNKFDLGGGASSSSPPGLKKQTENTDSNKMERNIRLLAMLQTYLDDFNMGIFKRLSGDFRKSDITAQKYYNDIHELLGENLKYIFSELVALLPDEQKRKELLIVHNNEKVKEKMKSENKRVPKSAPDYSVKAKWGASSSPLATKKTENNLSFCSHCGQTFPKEKIDEHMESHAGESFPALPVQVKKKKGYSFAPVRVSRQVPIKNAWSAN